MGASLLAQLHHMLRRTAEIIQAVHFTVKLRKPIGYAFVRKGKRLAVVLKKLRKQSEQKNSQLIFKKFGIAM